MKKIPTCANLALVESDELFGEVETQFLLFGLLLHTQPLNSSEQYKKADLEFSSDFGRITQEKH